MWYIIATSALSWPDLLLKKSNQSPWKSSKSKASLHMYVESENK